MVSRLSRRAAAPAARMTAATAAATAALSLATPARADVDRDPQTDFGAATLPQWDLRLGLARFDLGLTDNVMLGTLPLLFALKVKNLQLKWRFYQEGPWSLAASAGILSVNLQDYKKDAADVTFFVVPVQLTATYQLQPDLLFHGALAYSGVGTKGGAGTDDTDVEGVAVVDTAVLNPSVEYRLSHRTAAILDANVLLFQRARGTATETHAVDEYTSVEAHQKGGADLKQAFRGNLVLSFLWSWDVFNLRAGLGYGHLELPVAHLFAGKPTLVPDFDLWWRF